MLKVAIVGAGWYGCHLARQILAAGMSVEIFEATSDVFSGASGFNQSRLHLGFHYPRCYSTRVQCIAGYSEFLEVYPHLARRMPMNAYAVAQGSSLLDFETYLQVMKASNLEFQLISPRHLGLEGIAGCLTCEEQVIYTGKARSYFRNLLAPHLRFNHRVKSLVSRANEILLDGQSFDACINCTWATFEPPDGIDIYYEPCVTLVYKGPEDHPAITIMDGPFFSIYPHHEGGGLVTVTSVAHTPVGQFAAIDDARRVLKEIPQMVPDARTNIEDQLVGFYPAFKDRFEFVGHEVAIKTKIRDASDIRTAYVLPQGRLINVFSGKVDSVFAVERDVLACLNSFS